VLRKSYNRAEEEIMMRQEYSNVLREYNTSYDESRVKLQSQYGRRDAHDLVA
jgi:hypothetical protein